MTQRYVALVRIASDSEVWLPGSLIEMDDIRAALHMAAGNVAPLEGTVTPPETSAPVVVHEAVEGPEKTGGD